MERQPHLRPEDPSTLADDDKGKYHKCSDCETGSSPAEPQPCIPTRATIAIMTCLATIMFFMVRANFSLNLLAMVEKTDANGSAIAQPDFGPRIRWSAYQQSSLLGAFFYGYAGGAIPLGLLIEKYGIAKRYILSALLVCCALEVLSPWAAQHSFEAMFTVRLMMGIVQSAFFPAMHKLYSKWAPRNELGTFCFSGMGSSIGTLLTWLGTGVLIEQAGWLMSFYLPGGILVVFTLLWAVMVFETPDQHPRCTRTERQYITDNLPKMAEANTWPPLLQIATSIPCWALLLLQFGSDWGFYFVLTGVPKFLNEVLGFQLGSTGMLACLPYLSRWTFSFLYGLVADTCISRQWMTVTKFRKCSVVLSHILPGLFVLGTAFVRNQPYVCVAFMTVSLGFNGALAQTAICNYHDLAPNYASTLNAIMNGISSFSGVLTPIIVAYFTAEKNTAEQWQYVFMIGAAVYILPAILFMFLGSGKVQPWNDPDWKKVKKSIRGDGQEDEAGYPLRVISR